MQALRIFGTVMMFGGFGVAFFSIASRFGASGLDDGGGPSGFTVAVIGIVAFAVGMFLSDAGKTDADFKRERKAGKTTCYACGTKRRLEQSCPKCGAPPSSSV